MNLAISLDEVMAVLASLHLANPLAYGLGSELPKCTECKSDRLFSPSLIPTGNLYIYVELHKSISISFFLLYWEEAAQVLCYIPQHLLQRDSSFNSGKHKQPKINLEQ